MSKYGIFPFGNKVQPVVQEDQTPKEVFILGVYASAVHARWIGPDGKTKVRALAVASEPEIFWRGENVKEIIQGISIPRRFGQLVPAAQNLNGPSGRSIDEEYLAPLGLNRSDVWLSDIYPFTHMNKGQETAIKREYKPYVDEFGLPRPTLKSAPTTEPGKKKREEIWQEFIKSKASTLMLLGDKPIAWFLSFLIPEFDRLSDFGEIPERYGRMHSYEIRGRKVKIIPLVHPRQASRLGVSSSKWSEIHQWWKSNVARGLFDNA